MENKMTQSKRDELAEEYGSTYNLSPQSRGLAERQIAVTAAYAHGFDAGRNEAIEEVLGIIQKHRDECDWAISGEAIMEEIKSLKEKV